MTLPEQVLASSDEYNMLPHGQALGVAVSGGSDSTALLHILYSLAPRRGLRLTVLHFQHGLRGTESQTDEAFVRGMANHLGLPFFGDAWAEKPQANLEQSARQARLRFFQHAATTLGLNRIATGHTIDDQAETVLLRLFRGAGPAGLAGILPITGEGLIRPLLAVTRAELVVWLTERGISWREDSSNRQIAFAQRNRLRQTLLPELKRDWNPQIVPALARLAGLARADEQYWSETVAKLLPVDGIFEVDSFLRHPAAVQTRLIRAAIAHAKGDLRAIDQQHVRQVLTLFDRTRGSGRVPLPGRIRAERSFGQVRLGLVGTPPPQTAAWRLIRREQPAEGTGYNKARQYLDGDRVSGELQFRGWSPGDRYRPEGSTEARKLRDLFQEAKIPSWERRNWPILEMDGVIVWANRFGPAAGYGADSQTRNVIEVSVSESESKQEPQASTKLG